jgi:ATP-dependent protease ClpP protease subunit
MTASDTSKFLENKKLELEIKQLEDTERHQAAITRHEAALRKIELERVQLELKEKQISLQKLHDENQTRLARRHNLTYRFTKSVTQDTVTTCIQQLDLWSAVFPGETLEIVFTSPGGSVYAGLSLFDHIRMLSRRGHTMVTGAEGYAASMAGILLQAGDIRWVGEESWVLIHEVSSWDSGTTSDMSDSVEQMKRLQARIIRIFLDRASLQLAYPPATLMTETQFKAKWKKTDWWLDSAEALKYGFADQRR